MQGTTANRICVWHGEYKEHFCPKCAQQAPMDNPVNSVDKTLEERGARYGKFSGHAKITQLLKDAMRKHDNCIPWATKLSQSQREALEMIAHKIGRILNGDPNYADSWHDIAGYAKLVEDEINAKQS